MDKFNKLSCAHMGPGGLKCKCCGPKPGKDRKVMRRSTRRRLKQLYDHEMNHLAWAWDEMTDKQRIDKLVRVTETMEINKDLDADIDEDGGIR